MSKKQKKLKRKIERKEKRKQFHIDDILATLEREKNIDSSFPIEPEIPDYDEKMKENHLFSFVSYNRRECQLHMLNPVSAVNLVRKLKQLNETTIKELPSSRLIRDKIENVGNYQPLYEGLSPDVEIVEIQFTNAGRVFAYFVERYVCIVAIKTEHM